MPRQPLAEVFGFPIDNQSEEAQRYRNLKLCPFNNYIPNCTKDKANAPLGVCSVLHKDNAVITCPVRFREQWIIVEDAAGFFFPPKAQWTSISEVRLKDEIGKSAGNIDLVLVSYDNDGKLLDFGALEVQAVYISGNVRDPFDFYMQDPTANVGLDWTGRPKFPKPDFLSSSRKRLAPQLLFKGGILNSWSKKIAVALDRSFIETLPALKETKQSEAEVGWFVYEMQHNDQSNRFALTRYKTVYTKFDESLVQITVAKPGRVEDFITLLQAKLDHKRSRTPPSNRRLDQML